MTDKRETAAEPEEADTQQNHNAETEEDTASGGAAADPDPQDL